MARVCLLGGEVFELIDWPPKKNVKENKELEKKDVKSINMIWAEIEEKKEEYYICIIPDSNYEFEEIQYELKRLGVNYEKEDFGEPDCFSRMYRIPIKESLKLPHEDGEPWLPVTETSGHRIWIDSKNKCYNGWMKKYKKSKIVHQDN